MWKRLNPLTLPLKRDPMPAEDTRASKATRTLQQFYDQESSTLVGGGAGQLPTDLLRPYPTNGMGVWKVSSAVGKVKNDEAISRRK
jgi:hypothetical protein